MSRQKYFHRNIQSFFIFVFAFLMFYSGSMFAQMQFSQGRLRNGFENLELLQLANVKSGCCSAKSQKTPLYSLNPEYETYTLVGTYYSLNDNLTTTLMLNNKGALPLDATPTFYSLNGTRLQLAPITVPAASYSEINLRELLANAGEEFRQGSMKVAYQGKDYQLGSQVKLVDAQRSLIWAEQFVYTTKFVSSRLESVWWLPYEDSQTKFIVSNTTYSPVTVTVKVDGTTPQQAEPISIQLNPSQTRVLDVMRDLVGNENGTLRVKGGISITHTGTPGAVLAKMMIAKPDRGFSSTMGFIDPEATSSKKWHGNGLRIKNLNGDSLRQILVARNSGNQTAIIKGKIPYTKPNGDMAAVNIPETEIAADGTKVINLRDLIVNASVPSSVTYAGIELNYDRPKGTVIVQVSSVSENGNHVFQVPIFDPEKTPASAGGYPWKADGDYSTLVYIKNETDQPKKYTANVSFEGGGYTLGIKEIKRNQTVAIDFRSLRDSQTPDINGNIIPLNIDKGQIAWSVNGNENKTLSGRSEQISIANGLSSTYDCRNCCPNSFYDASIDPFEVYTQIGQSLSYLESQRDINCYGQIFPPHGADLPYFNSTDWNVATIGYSSGTASALGVGTTMIQASWEAGSWWDDGSERCDYIPVPVMQESPMEVIPTVGKIQYKGPNNTDFTDVTATLYILEDTQVTFKAIPNPANATFPAGKPVWSGTSGATGTGATISVTFGTVSSNTSDFKTVVATYGNSSITVNVIVYDLLGVLTPDDNFDTNRSTIKFGLIELVNLSFAANPAVTDTQAGGLKWIRSSGAGTGTVDSGDNGTGTFTAPEAAAATVLKLEVLNGPSKGKFITKEITTVAPSGARMIRTGNIKHTQGVWGGGFRAYIHFDPKDVSFKNIRFREGVCIATADGYLASFNGEYHAATGETYAMVNCNLTTGCRTATYDTAYFTPPVPATPYSTGSFNWPIPWYYYVTNEIFTNFTTADQTATSNRAGAAFISKKDIGPFTVGVGDPTSDY